MLSVFARAQAIVSIGNADAFLAAVRMVRLRTGLSVAHSKAVCDRYRYHAMWN